MTCRVRKLREPPEASGVSSVGSARLPRWDRHVLGRALWKHVQRLCRIDAYFSRASCPELRGKRLILARDPVVSHGTSRPAGAGPAAPSPRFPVARMLPAGAGSALARQRGLPAPGFHGRWAQGSAVPTRTLVQLLRSGSAPRAQLLKILVPRFL